MSDTSIHERSEYSNNLFKALAVQAGEGISLADTDENYLFVNDAFCAMTGYSYQELTGMKVRELLPPETKLSLFSDVARHKAGSREVLLRKKDGSRFLADVKGSPIELDGRLFVLGIISDVTEKRRNETIVEKFFEQPMNLHSIVGFDGEIRRVNNGTESILGYTKEEVEGSRVRDYLHPEEQEPIKGAMERIEEGQTVFSSENRFLHKDGAYRQLAWSAIASARDRLFFAVASDITERRRAEEELLKERNNLKEALAKVKKLSGMLPICSSCKKIRDDDGYWNQIETYLKEHSEVEFSHSLCPDCMKRLYPDVDERLFNGKRGGMPPSHDPPSR